MKHLVVAVALSGCSFALVRGPGRAPLSWEAPQEPRCTTSNMFPLFDTMLAGGALGLTVASLGQPDDEGDLIEPPVAVYTSLVAMVLAVSAVYGFVRADSCRFAKREFSLRVNARGR